MILKCPHCGEQADVAVLHFYIPKERFFVAKIDLFTLYNGYTDFRVSLVRQIKLRFKSLEYSKFER